MRKAVSRDFRLNFPDERHCTPTATACNAPARFLSGEPGTEMNSVPKTAIRKSDHLASRLELAQEIAPTCRKYESIVCPSRKFATAHGGCYTRECVEGLTSMRPCLSL